MNTKQTLITLSVLLGLTLGATAQNSAALARAARYWDDPAFVKGFMGSYGVETKDEPTVTSEEAKFMGTLVPLIKSDPAAAIRSLEGAIKAESSAALPFTLANIYLEQGRNSESETVKAQSYQKAIANYQEAIKRFPNFLRAYQNMGIVYADRGQFKEAAEALVKALDLGGEDGNIYGVLGYCYHSLKKYLSAEVAYEKAVMFAPDNRGWRIGYAACLIQLQRHREAAALFGELIEEEPDNIDHWLFQAESFRALDQLDQAAQNYEMVRRLGKATPDVLNILGDMYTNKRLLDLAFTVYQESFKLNPEQDLERPLRSVEILVNGGDNTGAEQLLQTINRSAATRMTEPQKLTALRLTSRIQLNTGRVEEAVKTLQQIVEREPMDGESLLLLADYYARQQGGEEARYDAVSRAVLYYERAEKIPGFTYRALLNHGQLLVAEKKYAEALPMLKQAQNLNYRVEVADYLAKVEQVAKSR